jgi:putative transposase
MMEKYQNKYRIDSARLKGYDYSRNGAYFITICTQNREHHFGEIQNGTMILSLCGVLADVFWYEILRHTEGVELGAFVVMPNHVHGILILNRNESPSDDDDDVETRHASSLQSPQSPQSPQSSEKNEQMAAISPKSGSVSVIVGSYKSAVTKHANRLGLPNGWQTRFHDHIIRNEAEYERIYQYIENNPANWEKDKFRESDNYSTNEK